MIKYTVMYPFTPGARFDHDYYRNHHVPMIVQLLGPVCKSYSISKGVSSANVDQPPPFVAMCDLVVDSTAAFQAAIGPHLDRVRADLVNFTDITPLRQFSDIGG